ncbi:MAG: hypothetical protein ACK58X_18795, partial [Planctomycetota bacterium]
MDERAGRPAEQAQPREFGNRRGSAVRGRRLVDDQPVRAIGGANTDQRSVSLVVGSGSGSGATLRSSTTAC